MSKYQHLDLNEKSRQVLASLVALLSEQQLDDVEREISEASDESTENAEPKGVDEASMFASSSSPSSSDDLLEEMSKRSRPSKMSRGGHGGEQQRTHLYIGKRNDGTQMQINGQNSSKRGRHIYIGKWKLSVSQTRTNTHVKRPHI